MTPIETMERKVLSPTTGRPLVYEVYPRHANGTAEEIRRYGRLIATYFKDVGWISMVGARHAPTADARARWATLPIVR